MRKTFHPDTPFVFCGIDRVDPEDLADYKQIYGLLEGDSGIRSTLDLILSVHPGINKIFFVADQTKSAEVMLEYVRDYETSYKENVAFGYLINMSMDELKAALKKVPPNSVVIWLHFIKDKNGKVLSLKESQTFVAKNTSVPVYVCYGFSTDSGIMGGSIISGFDQGEKAGKVAMQLLNKESIGTSPFFHQAIFKNVFDYNVMKRFNIESKDIPENSVIYNKPYSVLYRYRWQIIGIILFMVFQALLIGLLLVNQRNRKLAVKEKEKRAAEFNQMTENLEETTTSRDKLNAEIEERKKVEESLIEVQENLLVAQRMAHIGNWHWNIKTDIVWWSDELYCIYGLNPEEYTPSMNSSVEKMHPDDRERVRKAVDDALKAKKPYDVEMRVIRPGGIERMIHAHGEVSFNNTGNPQRMFGTAQDITESKQAEEALQNSQHYLDRIINAVGSPLFVKDINHKFCLVNDALCSLLNLSVEEIIGTTGYEHFPEDQMTVFIAKDQEVFTTGKENINEQFLTDGHGKIRTIVTRKTLYTDSAGNKFLVGVINDITDRKQAEERILQFNAELKNSNQELEQFAYVASHDLQEPLRMISSYTQLLERRYGDKLDQDAKDFIEFAVDGANRMQKLINDLLEFSRVTTRAKPSEEVDSYTILGRAITNLQQVIQETGTIVTNDDLPKIKADDSQLVRVFQNIIDNAIKFCSKESPRIHISAQEDENECIFSIRDNGIGIDEQYKNRIFNIFQRLHTKEEYPGTGIGLAICKRIVQRHNGRIWFKSELGKGTTFYFTLKK